MKQFLSFEESLYGDDVCFNPVDIENVDFWVEKIVKLPIFRPFF